MITLEDLKNEMKENGFDENVREEIITTLIIRRDQDGVRKFSQSLKNLHFTVPIEFQDEQTAIAFYKNHAAWIEVEVQKLEKETCLAWEVQAADLKDLDEKARKTQLVIRHRLTELVLDILDEK